MKNSDEETEENSPAKRLFRNNRNEDRASEARCSKFQQFPLWNMLECHSEVLEFIPAPSSMMSFPPLGMWLGFAFDFHS
jgi:hypothetical protein